MSSFRNTFLILMGLMLLVGGSLCGSLWAQQSELYNNFPAQLQTRNIPAGTVVDPGSQLLYIIDTGANLRAEVGADVSSYTSSLAVSDQGLALANPFGVGGTKAIYNDDGTLDADKINRSFITITNTHPTQAVTVHFRYFNDECVDVLDFLVVLTCNDTLIFDPFDFDIPGTTFNTQTRIFGPAVGLFEPIPASQFASGRFVIFATAAGTSYEPTVSVQDDNAELRFPAEFETDFVDAASDCDNLLDATYFGANSGLVADNLHVFNASAVAFNYLIGSFSTAVPFGGVFQAYGVNAWTRPAVDLTLDDLDNFSLRGQPDGDGPPLLVDQAAGGNDFRILTGRESVFASDGVAVVAANDLYLRNDVHGGDTGNVNDIDGDLVLDYDSFYGALGITSLFGAAPEDQLVHFLSAIDDYNGSRTAPGEVSVGGFFDRSYNLNGATTTYVLQIYNNDEEIFDVPPDTPINISPPPFEAPTAVLKIVVECLRTWITDVKSDATSVDDLQISDLGGIAGDLLTHIAAPKDPGDASLGWIRFVRDNTKFGTWRSAGVVADTADEASFVTIGLDVVRFSGFGEGWWLSSAASDPTVSATGDPTP
ncbi:MAG: hypothetical protein ACE5JX_11870 [Acidobacteriota bacterium]